MNSYLEVYAIFYNHLRITVIIYIQITRFVFFLLPNMNMMYLFEGWRPLTQRSAASRYFNTTEKQLVNSF